MHVDDGDDDVTKRAPTTTPTTIRWVLRSFGMLFEISGLSGFFDFGFGLSLEEGVCEAHVLYRNTRS